MSEHVKVFGVAAELVKVQQKQQENVDKAIPPWVRDGKEFPATFEAGAPVFITHKLGRKARGWLVMSVQASTPYSIVENSSSDQQLRLANADATGTVTCVVWVW